MVDLLIRVVGRGSASVLVAVLRAAMIALLMTFFGPWGASAATALPSTPTQVAHVYDAALYSEATIYTAPERGPPAYDCTVPSAALDHVLHGTPARPGDLIARPANDYDGIALLPRGDNTVGTPEQTGRASNGDLYALPAFGVAANTADRISGPLWSTTNSKTGPQNALRHFNDHGADFPHLNNAAEYVADAQQFLRTPPSGALSITRTNGDVVRYDPGRNIFGVMDSSGAPKTYFKPDPAQHGYPTNLDYFNAQNW